MPGVTARRFRSALRDVRSCRDESRHSLLRTPKRPAELPSVCSNLRMFKLRARFLTHPRVARLAHEGGAWQRRRRDRFRNPAKGRTDRSLVDRRAVVVFARCSAHAMALVGGAAPGDSRNASRRSCDGPGDRQPLGAPTNIRSCRAGGACTSPSSPPPASAGGCPRSRRVEKPSHVGLAQLGSRSQGGTLPLMGFAVRCQPGHWSHG